MADASHLNSIQIRPVNLSDAKDLLSIYAPYVETSYITFETEVPTLNQYQERIQKITSRFPWFVAEENGIVVGFAYATVFRERAAYSWALESSIYVKDSHQGAGSRCARLLYEALFATLRKSGIKQVIGVISLPNEKSVRFHEKLGFRTVGTFPSVGFKLGKWWDVLFMTKLLEDLPFSEPMI